MATIVEGAPGAPSAIGDDRTFFGHPRGLAYLAFTEAWERFSYYGMSALVVLYMVERLFLPGNVEAVAGMAIWRSALESVFGPLSVQGLASQTFGIYAGFVYFTPVLGGLIADRLLGAKRTVVIGALLMSAGHIAMAFDGSFLLALVLLVVGTGCLKGNITTQVGHLYAPEDAARRTRAFTLFSVAINVGAVLGPLVCGLLAQLYGWHIGFGAAGALMLLATATYLAGQHHLPKEAPRSRDRGPSVALTGNERRTVILLFLVMGITVFPFIGYFQFSNVGMIWVRQHVDLATPLGTIPVPWFNSIAPLTSIVAAPLLFVLWNWQAARGREPDDLGKIGIGAGLIAASASLLLLASFFAGEDKASPLFPFAARALSGIGFIYYWPPTLALVSRSAPARVNATMMGIAFLALFAASLLMGWVGSFYEAMTPAAFWALTAGLSAIGAVLVLIFGRPLMRGLRP
jgi:POT family proton-dependent oligopeptide transporter